MKRGVSIGLDIGSNSVGSAWVDEDQQYIEVGCSVFPAGVEDSETGRGAPKNQARREKRSARRNISRRSSRKRALRKFLIREGFLPRERAEAKQVLEQDPWQLRAIAMEETVLPHQFGRILLHLAQRRGAAGLKPIVEDDDSEKSDAEGPIKEAIDHTRKMMSEHECTTFGQLVARIAESEATPVLNDQGKPKRNEAGDAVVYRQKIRNSDGHFRFHADREMIRSEFKQLWDTQKALGGPLAEMLTDEVRLTLDCPQRDQTWRHKGLLFQQRNTYWDVGTLGRCDLEPSDRAAPFADYYASRFRVIEYVNNIRIKRPGCDDFQPLMLEEHAVIVDKLGSQKTASIKTIRSALKIDTASLKNTNFSTNDYQLNIERDELRPPNTDWFARAIINEALVANGDAGILEKPGKFARLNKAILRFDPAEASDVERLENVLRHLGLGLSTIEAVVDGWRSRPKLEKRSKLSRRAIRNLLPYMEQPTEDGHWRTQIEARREFADDPDAIDVSRGKPAETPQRERYRLGGGRLNSAARHYLKKHPEELLPLPPVMTNPVVRKAIYEVRRHIISYLKRHPDQKPERIIIEFAREATKPAIVNDRILARNRNRDKIRRTIREEILKPAWGAKYQSLTHNQIKQAELRVLLCQQQRGVCAYSLDQVGEDHSAVASFSGRSITPRQAALGNGLEIDHVIPHSRCGDNSLSNKVLCYIDSNREKGNKTLREWWGDKFDDRIKPMRFMENAKQARGEYFETRDLARKWKNLSAEKVPKEWKGSQLTDTAYAAREVQKYLEAALWPDELSFLAGGAKRRVFVTRGGNTAKLRRDWQLYQQADANDLPPSPEENARNEAKNRGDHREHSIDAVVIALTSEARLQSLARDVHAHNEAWTNARRSGARPQKLCRDPLSPPWSDVRAFRKQVLSLVYPDPSRQETTAISPTPLVVCHRAVGRKLSGNLHKETLLSPAINHDNGYVTRENISSLKAKHLRLPVVETPKQSIDRLARRYQQNDENLSVRDARRKAKAIVDGSGFKPAKVDPSPEQSGLIRDIGLRRRLREQVKARLEDQGIARTVDTFTNADLNKINSKDYGPFTQTSGVPIKSFRLLHTINQPVEIDRREFDYENMAWHYRDSKKEPKSLRAYRSGNNHHLEIRENEKGKWNGKVVSMSDAAHRAKRMRVDPVDHSDDPKDGKFVMSLAIGETVFMRDKKYLEDKACVQQGYYVVVMLNTEKKRAEFCAHWDARRAGGEKDGDNKLIPESKRRTIPVSPAQMQELAPPGHTTPVKVMVTPLGDIHVIEPHEPPTVGWQSIDPVVVEIAREGMTARRSRDPNERSRHRRYGSWSWMRAKLRKAGKEHLAAELSAATRLLKSEGEDD